MKNLIPICTLIAVLTIYSCRSKDESKGLTTNLAEMEQSDSDVPKKKIENTPERKIIKEGEIAFETDNVKQTKSLITHTVKELNGYISKDDANNYSGTIEHRLVIRVPSENFDLLLNKISESVKKLDRKNINVLDVTAEFIDIEARIKTKKELQERYREILKKASKVDEILLIEKEIGQLQTDIESVEGQMKYLKDRISYSTLNVTYYEKTSELFGFSSKFGGAIKSGWDYLLIFIVAVAHLWAFILVAVISLFVILRLGRPKKKRD